ncbi:MAG: T9SS type A sorting domain-containing protein [Lentimicrobiaceae bacterium]|nr:T9SS type A sorting domain-containing protein [Lentimicrobiaceae bacterium]MDD4598689.1 T9SS type A sorting domain-containing protein [Lentimicrobiaceae bacterium]
MKLHFRHGFILAIIFCGFFWNGITLAQPSKADTAAFPYWIEMMKDPSANFYETQRAFNVYWEGREVTKGSGYKPFKRWEYMMQQRVSPEGIRPLAERNIRAFSEYTSTRAPQTNASNWQPLGPFTVPSGQNGYRGLGRVNAIAFHPTDENTVYIGAPSGGLWKTTDNGLTWVSFTDVLPTLGVSDIVVDHTEAEVIYMGTGDRDAGDAPGLGVWKSFDGGETWQPSNTGMGNVTVSKLIMHPNNNQLIMAATNSGIYKSTDGGLSWSKKASGDFKDLVFKPDNPNIVYGAQAGNFFRSVNNGETFTRISNGLPTGYRSGIAVTPANPELVYFIITNSDSFKGLYRSTDAGLSFSLRSTQPNIMAWDCAGGSGGQAWYDLDIAADPVNPEVIYAGGVNCFKSTNGGNSWFITSHWTGDCGVQAVHADLHVLEFSPLNNRLYAGNDGGAYWTGNEGQTWTEISDGLVISQAYKIGQSATNRDLVINGYQDNGTSTYIGGTWEAVGGGDGMECAFDPNDDRYSYSTVYYGVINRIFNHYPQGRIAGQNVNGITESGAWVTPFLIDHNDGNIMFIGYKNVWRSTNIKASSTNSVSWTKISDINTNNLSVLVQSRANTDIIYAANGANLYRSDNVKAAAVQWTTLSSNLPVNKTITAIETSPADENVVYVVQQNKIFKSINKGLTWQDITGGLPDVQMNTLVYYRNSPEGLYLGTDIGVFYKDAPMEDWILYSNGFPVSGIVTELEIYYDSTGPANDVIRAGTYGRGLWESPMNYSIPQPDFVASETIVPIGCPIDFTDLSLGIPYEWSWTFPGAETPVSTQQNPSGIVWNTEGIYSVSLTVTNPAGTNTEQKTAYITVSSDLMPVPAFTASERVLCSGTTTAIKLYDESQFCPAAWQWSFSPDDVTFVNETTAASPNPEVILNGNSNYDITLQVTNANGTSTLSVQDYILTGGMPSPFMEDWETQSLQTNGWVVENPDNKVTWELLPVNGVEQGTVAAGITFYAYDPPLGKRDRLISPPLNFKGFNEIVMGFSHAYARRYAQTADSLIVLISTDCGDSWERIATFADDGSGNFETHPLLGSSLFVPETAADWCGAPGNPACIQIDLTPWVGMENLKIAFESVHRLGNALYIDNIYFTNAVPAAFEKQDEPNIQIYPNPANDRIFISSAENLTNAEVTIYNATGKKVYVTSGLNGKLFTIETSSFDAGLYLISVQSGNVQFRSKLMIN